MLFQSHFRLEQAACKLDHICRYKVVVSTLENMAPLMPYINAVARVVFYDPEEPVIVFRLEDRKVALRPYEVQIAEVENIEEGRIWREKVEKFLEKIVDDKASLTPRYEPKTLPPALEIYKLLPKTNCGKCGEKTCLAFATKLSTGEAVYKDCKPLLTEEYEEARENLARLLGED